jgi:long-chain fatty acid transport protein
VPSLSYKLNDKWSVGISLPISYAGYELENAVLNVGEPDGEMELDADGVAISFNAGVLYQHSVSTRFGASYRSAVDMELEGEPDFSGLSDATRNLLDAAGLLDTDVEIESQLPPIIAAGVYHEFDNGWGWALDVARIQWSEFKLTEFGFLNGTLYEQDPDYEDVWAGSTGVSIPVAERWKLGLGVAFADSPVDKETRTFSFRADETWIFGAGLEYDRGEGRTITFNLNYLALGEGRIETPSVPVLGNLSAEYDEHWGLIFDLQFSWGS